MNLHRIGLVCVALPAAALLGAKWSAHRQALENVPDNMKVYYLATAVPGPKYTGRDSLLKAIPGHLKWLRGMIEQKKILLAGPFQDEGHALGLSVVAASSKEEAERWVAGDPAGTSGVFVSEVRPIRLPDLSSLRITYGK